MSLSIQLDRQSQIYIPGETLKGAVCVQGPVTHSGLTLQVEGAVALQLSPRKVGLFEALNAPTKPLTLLSVNLPLAGAGRFPSGSTLLPFEIPLRPAIPKLGLCETYHGVFVNVQYFIVAEMDCGVFARRQREMIQFVIANPGQAAEDTSPKPVRFTLEPKDLRNVKGTAVSLVPAFRIHGRIDSVVCDISKPFTGVLCVEQCDVQIDRIDLQLVRVEFCATQNGVTKEVTEIQNIQIAEGDVCRGLELPLYMVFPRWFTCPTLVANNFKVEFEVNVVVLFQDKRQVIDNFPVRLYRPHVTRAKG